MVAANGSANGHANGQVHETLNRIAALEEKYLEERKARDPQSTYLAGETDRMNPTPKGICPYGSDADYHYRTARNFYLMVERGRAAVRNHPLVEQGINRLIANLKIGEFTLDLDSGDPDFDADHKAWWKGWCGETAAGRNLCDYEGSRTFQQLSQQSFFSQVTDGDILHVPLFHEGSLQTWESHHMRNPFGHRPTGLPTDGIVHGAEVRGGRVVAYHITPYSLQPGQVQSRRFGTQKIDAEDEEGNRLAFWLGFRHRFAQRRGISRLSPPRDAMNGFDDLNYANIKSALRRSLISYIMASNQPTNQASAFIPGLQGGGLPQAGDRYSMNVGLGLESIVIEQSGEPAQVFKTPPGYTMQGWNANMPGEGFFEHSALLLTMLAVNLDMPLMFLLLDGSLVNFHGGRMTFDQAKLRFRQLQSDQLTGLWNPTYVWKTRQRLTPGSPFFDRTAYALYKRGKVNPFNYQFRPAAWPYVKPLEDAAGEDLAERRNLKSMRSLLADRGIDLDDHRPEVIKDRGQWIRAAIIEAKEIQKEHADIIKTDDIPRLWREILYGNETSGVQLAISADEGKEPEVKPMPQAAKGK